MANILIVEDEKNMQDIIAEYMQRGGHTCFTADDGIDALMILKNNPMDLMILDIMMPNLDGFSVCKVAREMSNFPIIMLTALSDEENQLRGFEQQIDDYIPKPFSPKILLCKIAAILRRGLQDNIDKDIIIYKDLRMDIEGFHLYCKEQEVILTQKEFDLLRLLLENQGRVFTRQMLLDRLWDFDTYVEDRIVDSHIKNLRKKLNVDYIETIRGVGYRIDKSN